MGVLFAFLALHLLHQRHEAVGVEYGTVELDSFFAKTTHFARIFLVAGEARASLKTVSGTLRHQVFEVLF